MRCDSCGAMPGVRVKFREISGLIIAFRLKTHDLTLCRSCGTAQYRESQDNTLMKGWWGFFAFFANLWAIFANWRASTRVAALQAPHDAERPEGPLDPGPLLRTRRGVKVAGVVLGGLLALMVIGTFGEDEEYVDVDELPGQCVTLQRTGESIEYDTVECSGPHDATVINVVDRAEQCSPNAEEILQLDMLTGPDRFACLDTD